jgi:hypothetical protein
MDRERSKSRARKKAPIPDRSSRCAGWRTAWAAIAEAGVRGRLDRVQKLLNLAFDKRRRFAFGPRRREPEGRRLLPFRETVFASL